MTATLNMLAVQNAAVLRALRAMPHDGWGLTELAKHLNRDKSNLLKTLDRLEKEGLLRFNPLTHGLSDAGQRQLDMISRAENGGAHEPGLPEGAGVTGMFWLRHAEIQPDPDNARRDWESDEARDDLDGLRADIVTNGLLQNLVVRGPDAEGKYTLVGGERRWRAIGEAITDGDIEADTPFACRLLEADDLGVRLAALAENLQRRNLNPIEKARAFEGLADAGLSNKEIAERVSSTPEHIQQHRRFLQLDEADQQRMTLAKDDPRHLSVRDARQKLATKSQTEEAAAAQAERDAKITPEIRLAMAEFAHRLSIEATYTYADLPVGADARQHPTAVALSKLGWLLFSSEPQTYGAALGYYSLRVSYSALQELPAWRNSQDRDELYAGLANTYAEFGVPAPANGYINGWLNPDPDLTPEGEAIIAEAQQRADAARAQREKQEEADRLRRERWARAREEHAALLSSPAEIALKRIGATTMATAEAIDHPLPWTLFDNGEVKDAQGEMVKTFGQWGRVDDQDMALAQIIVVAVNSAAGLDTPPILSSAEAESEEGDDDEGAAAEEEEAA
ncbi:ParB/RepB/Spo0J family partition protein [Brevundimonas sp.]|uniref:ParB/RepB/Spo0J family partition protein n=1 Tax=Brevundimonas sp. TaxID=1871086 RepID=UPI0028A1D3F9|nr:ParB/RepB/Spo0J family partition protein [Brevundimonas sp.]